jgi:hypothetical protein
VAESTHASRSYSGMDAYLLERGTPTGGRKFSCEVESSCARWKEVMRANPLQRNESVAESTRVRQKEVVRASLLEETPSEKQVVQMEFPLGKTSFMTRKHNFLVSALVLVCMLRTATSAAHYPDQEKAVSGTRDGWRQAETDRCITARHCTSSSFAHLIAAAQLAPPSLASTPRIIPKDACGVSTLATTKLTAIAATEPNACDASLPQQVAVWQPPQPNL